MRDHEPVKLTKFNGLWKRGDAESTPLDHFSDSENIKFFEDGFESRPGIAQYSIDPNLCINYSSILRAYAFTKSANRLLVLDDVGNIYDTGSPTPCTPILTIATMTDFAMVTMNGRAYINPNDGVEGLEDEFIYVYLGDGTVARKAGGTPPILGTFAAANGAAGTIEAGYHVIGVAYETNTGHITSFGTALINRNVPGALKLNLTNIPVSPDAYVVARRIYASKLVHPVDWTGDNEGYELFFVDRIDNNTATTLTIDFYDAELLEDGTYLLELFEFIPAGVNLTTYHQRLVSIAEYGEANVDPLLDTVANMALVRVSSPGQPEAVNQVDGLILVPNDGLPLTNAQEYRDVLYFFKNTRTYSVNDNGDVPSSWPVTTLDQGLGAGLHAIASVLDSGGISTDYLLIGNYSGIFMFNGGFINPQLTYKIDDLWLAIDRLFLNEMQIMNDTVTKIIYIAMPDRGLLTGDYSVGLSPKDIKWSTWLFELEVTTIALINTNMLIIGSTGIP